MRALLLAILIPTAALAQPEPSPYAGEQSRSIKALSDSQVRAFLEGHGMGLARAAELNHYPGPRHVLELAEQLALSEEQIQKTRDIERRMKNKAIALGKQRVELERSLDRAFATGEIDAESLTVMVMRIAMLDGEIRIAHLAAHLEMKALLTETQIDVYDRLRGYEDGSTDPGHRGHGH